jgi:FixJ family two-component response regulator
MKIMLTGQSDFSAVKKSINKANLFSYIEKPFINEDLMLTVKSACETHKTRVEMAAECLSLREKVARYEKLLTENGISLS